MNLVPTSLPSTSASPSDVAAVLARIAGADGELAEVLDRVAASRAPVSTSTVMALEQLLATLRPAASERERLASVDRATLRASIRLWSSRQLTSSPDAGRSGAGA